MIKRGIFGNGAGTGTAYRIIQFLRKTEKLAFRGQRKQQKSGKAEDILLLPITFV